MAEEKSNDLDNIVLVSNKPISAYILATERVFERSDTLIIKARGKNINKVVNLAEILKRKDIKVDSIVIGTDTMKSKEDKDVFVSRIEVVLKK